MIVHAPTYGDRGASKLDCVRGIGEAIISSTHNNIIVLNGFNGMHVHELTHFCFSTICSVIDVNIVQQHELGG